MDGDIIDRVKIDFGNNSNDALKLLEIFESKNKVGPRVIRSIVSLSKGAIDTLEEMIKLAEKDWRDVLMEAENDCL